MALKQFTSSAGIPSEKSCERGADHHTQRDFKNSLRAATNADIYNRKPPGNFLR